jgi:hypothetical protein
MRKENLREIKTHPETPSCGGIYLNDSPPHAVTLPLALSIFLGEESASRYMKHRPVFLPNVFCAGEGGTRLNSHPRRGALVEPVL